MSWDEDRLDAAVGVGFVLDPPQRADAEDSLLHDAGRITRRWPDYTTLAGAIAAVEGIRAMKTGTLEVAPLQSHFKSTF